MPPAPPTFSTTIGLRSVSPICCANRRPTATVGPPAAYGTTSVIGRVGQSSARAVPEVMSVAATKTKGIKRGFMGGLLILHSRSTTSVAFARLGLDGNPAWTGRDSIAVVTFQ